MTVRLTLNWTYRPVSRRARKQLLSGLLWLAILAATISAGQSSKPPMAKREAAKPAAQKRADSIKGRVLDEAGQPFANVVVNIHPVDTEDEEREVATDDDGSFQVKGLSARPYVVACNASGYVSDDDDKAIAYHLAGDVVTLRLRQGGVITGTVFAESGEPIINAVVVATRMRDGEGRALQSPETYGGVEADDRGIYRIYGLETGAYVVRVDRIGKYDDQHLRNEASLYYPSATRDDAQEVKVNRGEETVGIDIHYRRQPGHLISGKCTAATAARSSDNLYVMLVHARSGMIQSGSWDKGPEKRGFAYYGVPDGDYYLIAQDDSDEPTAASSPLRVTVKGSDVTGVDLKLAPLGSISGRVVIETTPRSNRKPACKPARKAMVEETIVNALRHAAATAKDQPPPPFTSAIRGVPDENGDFTLKSLAPGPYRVKMELANDDLYVRAVTLPARAKQVGAAASNTFTLKSSEQVKGILITMADGAAVLRGRVVALDEQARRPAPLVVHLVPTEREHADNAARYAETTVAGDGAFAFKNLAPGRYWILVRPLADNESPDTAWPAAVEAASRIILRRAAEAANLAIDLQPCQHVNDYRLPYPLATPPLKPAGGAAKPTKAETHTSSVVQ